MNVFVFERKNYFFSTRLEKVFQLFVNVFYRMKQILFPQKHTQNDKSNNNGYE